jgi:hypothetical protein
VLSRTNISILLATALLGVLMWVVISMVRDLARAPAAPLAPPVAAADNQPDPALPKLRSRSDVLAWLAQQSYQSESEGMELIENYRDWLRARGYSASTQLLGAASLQEEELAAQDDALLLLLAGQGDINATQLLAERSLQTDPLAALEWYDKAIVDGSVYAMLRVADLLTTLAEPELAEFVSDPQWQAALKEINSESPAPLERALAWSIAAVTIGGYATLDTAQEERITSLSAQLGVAARERACSLAQDYVLQTAAARRMRGGAVFSTATPALAISVAEPQEIISCSVPVMPLVSLADCEQARFNGPGNRTMSLWLCPQYD